jgi:hypothetical protein
MASEPRASASGGIELLNPPEIHRSEFTALDYSEFRAQNSVLCISRSEYLPIDSFEPPLAHARGSAH